LRFLEDLSAFVVFFSVVFMPSFKSSQASLMVLLIFT